MRVWKIGFHSLDGFHDETFSLEPGNWQEPGSLYKHLIKTSQQPHEVGFFVHADDTTVAQNGEVTEE